MPKPKSINKYLESKNIQTIEQKTILVKREYFFGSTSSRPTNARPDKERHAQKKRISLQTSVNCLS